MASLLVSISFIVHLKILPLRFSLVYIAAPNVGQPTDIIDLASGQTKDCEMATSASQRQFLALKLDSLTDSEVQEVLDYIGIMESMRRSRAVPSIWEDEVLAVLADARENQRARQAFEWEAVRRKAERRAAAKANATI